MTGASDEYYHLCISAVSAKIVTVYNLQIAIPASILQAAKFGCIEKSPPMIVHVPSGRYTFNQAIRIHKYRKVQ